MTSAAGRTVVNGDGLNAYVGVETEPGDWYVVALAGVTDLDLVARSVFFE